MNLEDYERMYYCPYCYKPKVNEWGVNIPYCWTVECRKKYDDAVKEKQEYEKIKNIVKQVLKNEHFVNIIQPSHYKTLNGVFNV